MPNGFTHSPETLPCPVPGAASPLWCQALALADHQTRSMEGGGGVLLCHVVKNTPKSHPLPPRSFPLWPLWGGKGEAFMWRGPRWPWEQAMPCSPPQGAGRGGWRAPGTPPRSRRVTNSCNQPDTMSVLAASSEAVAASSRGHRVPVLSAEGICLLCRGARREIKM